MKRDMLRHHRPLDRFVDKERLKTFRFEIEDTEKADTSPGTFEAVKLKRVPLPGEKPAYIWAAPRLCYLPAVHIAYQRQGNRWCYQYSRSVPHHGAPEQGD